MLFLAWGRYWFSLEYDYFDRVPSLFTVTDIVMRKGENISVCAEEKAETLVVSLLLLLVFGSFLCQAI